MTFAALALALVAAAESGLAGERRPACLVRVVDGDTIRVDIDLGADVTLRNQPIRILGIDAPELRGPERSRGAESKAALEQFLGAKPLAVELHGKDKYGRWLADVFAGDENAALWMLRQRFAEPYQIGRRAPESPAVPSSSPQATKPRQNAAVA